MPPPLPALADLLAPSLVLGVESHRGELAIRLLVALALTWAVGFERELRGAAAGDRTFSLVGLGSAVVGYLALDGAPHALGGVLTGIGFVGAGVIFGNTGDTHDPDKIHGVTTAAALFLVAAIGMAAGRGELLLAALATGAALFLLEVRHQRWLRFLDGRWWRQEKVG